MQNKNVIHVLSGGLDSTTLLYWLLANDYNVTAIVSFNYGQRHNVELRKARETVQYINEQFKLSIPHHVVDISGIGSLLTASALTSSKDVPKGHYEDESMKLTVVPNRNMAFLSLVAMKAVNDKCSISIGLHAGDHAIYPDCRPEFTEAFKAAVRIGNWGAEDFDLITPFLYASKAEVVAYGVQSANELAIQPHNIFSRTWTCYDPQLTLNGVKACGKCGSCTERLEAFVLNKIEDPIDYVEDGV